MGSPIWAGAQNVSMDNGAAVGIRGTFIENKYSSGPRARQKYFGSKTGAITDVHEKYDDDE